MNFDQLNDIKVTSTASSKSKDIVKVVFEKMKDLRKKKPDLFKIEEGVFDIDKLLTVKTNGHHPDILHGKGGSVWDISRDGGYSKLKRAILVQTALLFLVTEENYTPEEVISNIHIQCLHRFQKQADSDAWYTGSEFFNKTLNMESADPENNPSSDDETPEGKTPEGETPEN